MNPDIAALLIGEHSAVDEIRLIFDSAFIAKIVFMNFLAVCMILALTRR